MGIGWERRRPYGNRTTNYVTWLQVWMEANDISCRELARVIMSSDTTVENWRKGRPVSRHYARLMRAYFPDCPISQRGGPSPRISDKLPINARTPKIYRFLLRELRVMGDTTNAQAVMYARQSTGWSNINDPHYDPIKPEYAAEAERTDPRRLEAGQGAVTPGDPDGGGVGDVLEP